MSHPDQLREYARDCLRLSQEMTSPELKIHLLNMAEAWAALAAQSERIAALCATVPALSNASPPLATDGGSDGSEHSAYESASLSPDLPEPMAERPAPADRGASTAEHRAAGGPVAGFRSGQDDAGK